MLSSTVDIEMLQTIPDLKFMQGHVDQLPSSSSLPMGHLIKGRYVIIREINRGSMGVVYETYDANNSQPVAMKLLSPELMLHKDCLDRFRREIETATAIKHNNVCGLLDTGTCRDGTPYIVMELLRGMTLTELLARWGKVSVERIVPLVLDLLAGLDAAHRLGIVHRDIKPDNVFLDYSQDGLERLKLLDFGISKTLDATVGLTNSGTVLGTPLYMSPEQIRGGDIDQRSDIWGVGIVLYEALAGCFPFDSSDLRALFRSIHSENPEPLVGTIPGVSQHLEAVIFKALEKEPYRRYNDAADLSMALRAAMRAHDTTM